MNPIATIVLGGTGYVAGELLRLLAGHPQLEVTGVMSESRAGTKILWQNHLATRQSIFQLARKRAVILPLHLAEKRRGKIDFHACIPGMSTAYTTALSAALNTR